MEWSFSVTRCLVKMISLSKTDHLIMVDQLKGDVGSKLDYRGIEAQSIASK